MSAFVQMIPLYVSLFFSKKQWDATYAGFSKDSLPKVDRNEKQRDAHLISLARLFIQSTQRFFVMSISYYYQHIFFGSGK